jgi:hypothetical protein
VIYKHTKGGETACLLAIDVAKACHRFDSHALLIIA